MVLVTVGRFPLVNDKYGFKITDVSLGDINVTEKSMERINKIDDATIFSNANLQSGLMASATADAMKKAADNKNGAMMGFAGLNMAQGAGGAAMNAANQNAQAQGGMVAGAVTGGKFCPNCGAPTNGGNFCSQCGNKLN